MTRGNLSRFFIFSFTVRKCIKKILWVTIEYLVAFPLHTTKKAVGVHVEMRWKIE